MSEYNLLWRRYWLRSNPYNTNPLSIGNSEIPLSSFVGRKPERAELRNAIISGGSPKIAVTGDPGVGKTSLVNFVRSEIGGKAFLSPIREIELNTTLSGVEFMLLTLAAIYDETKNRTITLPDKLDKKLETVYDAATYLEIQTDTRTESLFGKYDLAKLFGETVDWLRSTGYRGVILHYDNLDEIEDPADILKLLSETRDFLQTPGVTSIFVGDQKLHEAILQKDRVRQTFVSTITLIPLDEKDVREILQERVRGLKLSDERDPIAPHDSAALQTLFKLHDGIIRDVFNGFTQCALQLPRTNTPIRITSDTITNILPTFIHRKYISKLTPKQVEVLLAMMKFDIVTPTQLEKETGVLAQNLSSKYLKRLEQVGTITKRKREGRYVYYGVRPEVRWYTLKPSKKKTESQYNQYQSRLGSYFDEDAETI